jgi:acetoin utilization deacetylase AcuC-like enzyme
MAKKETSRTVLVQDPVFLEHDTGSGHPERSDRLRAIAAALQERGLDGRLPRLPLREATEEELLRVHTKDLIGRVAATASRSHDYLDGDTPTSTQSYHAALLAAGSLINATDAVIAGEADNAFALVRPPGHHAEPNRSMGFCLFNNIAVATAHALARHDLQRVLIVDWDVHHGNSTQHTFDRDPRVMFFSIHRFPFYPGTGAIDEIGEGPGSGFTINVPCMGGQGDEFYDAAFARILTPAALAFKPELVLISAGFDAHYRDPLGGMEVTEEGFTRLAARVKAIAETCCGGKMVATLEGGYDLQGLASSTADVIEVFMGAKNAPATPLAPPSNFARYAELARQLLGRKWPGIGESA